MRLSDYLDQPGRTASALAAKCGVAVSTITRVAAGNTTARPALIAKIIEHTGGEVTLADLIDLDAAA